jgi:hypothetical protein
VLVRAFSFPAVFSARRLIVELHINVANEIMKTYRVYSHPNKPVSTVVKVGFSWPAFILGPLWFLLNKMWLNFAIVTALVVGSRMYFSHINPTTEGEKLLLSGMYLLYLVAWFLIGKLANFLLCSDLEDEGYVLQTTVQAKNVAGARDEAEKTKSQRNELPAA